MDVVTCEATTKKGAKCSKTRKYGLYCHVHKSLGVKLTPNAIPKESSQANTQEDNSETTCSVCFENVTPKEDTNLSCKHHIHIACARKLHDARCPVCRMNITSANSKLKANQISTIEKRRKKDVEEEEERLTGNMLREEMDMVDIEASIMDIEASMMDAGQLFEELARAIHSLDTEELLESSKVVIEEFTKQAYLDGSADVFSEDFHELLHVQTGVKNCYFLRKTVEDAISSLLE